MPNDRSKKERKLEVGRFRKAFIRRLFESTSNIEAKPLKTANRKRQIVDDMLLPDRRATAGVSQPFIHRVLEQKTMKCSDLQSNLSVYADGFLAESERALVDAHLNICPLCRQTLTEIREIRAAMRQMRRAEISVETRDQIKRSVRGEIFKEKQRWIPVSSGFREWMQMRLMPFSVGVFTSLLVGVTFLTMMFSGMLRTGNVTMTAGGGSSVMLANNSNPFRDQGSAEISPSDYAQTRLGFASESPSINPQGALIALTRSLVRGGMKDDEVVVVADIFGSGLAQIAEVVEPSRNRRAVMELQKALESDPAYAAFVPADMENRPDSVRVVLKFQSVDVSTHSKPDRRRR